MNNEDICLVIEICLLAMQGKSDYELVYQSSFSPDLSRMGVELSHYLKYLILQHENKI